MAQFRDSRYWSKTSIRVAGIVSALVIGGIQAQTNGDAGEEVTLNEIVAKVNTDIITLTDLNDELERLQRAVEAQVPDPAAREKRWQQERREALRNMIFNRMITQRAEELGMAAGIEEEVNRIIAGVMKEFEIPDLETFKAVLQQQGTTYEAYRQAMRERMIIQTMQRRFVFDKITILKDEVEAFYNENIDEFTDPPEVELAEIVLLTEGKDRTKVRNKAEDVMSRLKAGEPFDDLARQFSEGATAASGGNIGIFKKGQMSEPIEAAAFSLAPSETSELIEADYGFVILKLISAKPATPRPVDDVRQQIVFHLQSQKAAPFMKTFLDELRQESYVFVSPKYHDQFNLEGLL